MLPNFLLAFREGLEAALILGIMLSALNKMGRPQLRTGVWLGFSAGVAFSISMALLLNFLGTEFEGTAEKIFEGTTMLLAACLLTWMIFWMQRQSRNLSKDISMEIEKVSPTARRMALFSLAFFSIAREGLELALFLTAARGTTSSSQVLTGALVGLASAAVLGFLVFSSTVRLPLKTFFLVTNLILIVFAAGLLAHGIREFNEAGIIPPVIEHVWNLNPFLDDKSIAGSFLSTLTGYNGTPSLTEVIGYAIYCLALIGFLWVDRRRQQARQPVPSS